MESDQEEDSGSGMETLFSVCFSEFLPSLGNLGKFSPKRIAHVAGNNNWKLSNFLSNVNRDA